MIINGVGTTERKNEWTVFSVMNDYLSDGGIAVIPGFQGISKSGDITSI